MDPFTVGAAALDESQINVLDECLIKESGGLSLPMGSGKTLISILVGLQQTEHFILVIAAKNLVASWEHEIYKFFGDTLEYQVLHHERTKVDEWKPGKNTKLIIATPEVVSKAYKTHSVEQYYSFYENINPLTVIKYYHRPLKPFLNHPCGGGYLYSVQWGCLIVDEAQIYTKITTRRCQAIAALCAKHRWALSGTLFDEPVPERILGYYLMLDIPNAPRCLPDMIELMKSDDFGGLQQTLVMRKENVMFKPPKIDEIIVTHSLSEPEAKLYTTMRGTLKLIRDRIRNAQLVQDTENVKRFSSYLLAILTYLRQGLVCPIIPITSVAIDMADYQRKSELSEILTEQINTIGIGEWLADVESVKSTRIKQVLARIDQHPKEKVVVFSCFRNCLNILNKYLHGRKILTISANMRAVKRGQVLEDFENTSNGILLLTYELGGVGLNLQCASVIMLMDFWWNASRTRQAVARVLRFGQQAKVVSVYFFTSNTGLERALFKKQHAKLMVLEELYCGASKTKIPTLNLQEIIALIEEEDNKNLLENINHI